MEWARFANWLTYAVHMKDAFQSRNREIWGMTEKQLSHRLSYLLRHALHGAGLTLQPCNPAAGCR